ERDAGVCERERLLASPTEDERVAALQTHDLVSPPAERDQQRVDLVLVVRVAGNEDRILAGLGDELLRDQPVVHEHVALADELEPANGDQARVAGPRADEVDRQERDSSTARSKKSLRSR